VGEANRLRVAGTTLTALRDIVGEIERLSAAGMAEKVEIDSVGDAVRLRVAGTAPTVALRVGEIVRVTVAGRIA
jgi:hypothetical protein